MKSIQAMIIADQLRTLDAETLELVAARLVRDNHQKADSFQFAINVAIHESLMAHGFSKKINQN
jgi:hypothetical protein